LLESQLRRLKIEYECYFSNPTKKPPTDVEWKVVEPAAQVQRWRTDELPTSASATMKWRSATPSTATCGAEGPDARRGYRRPQDALLSVQGVRPTAEHEPQHHPVYGLAHAAAASGAAGVNEGPLTIQCSDARTEHDQVEKLYQALDCGKEKSRRIGYRQHRQLHVVCPEED